MVERIEAVGILNTSKLAWKFSAQRQAITYRLMDLGESTIREWSMGHLLPSIVLPRAFLETSALVHSIVQRASEALELRDINALDALIMQQTFGARLPNWIEGSDHVATNVLTALDHMSKDIEFIRTFYEQMSEIAHPNAFGTSQFYGKTDRTGRTVTFSLTRRKPSDVFGTVNLALLGAAWSVRQLSSWDAIILRIASLQAPKA